MHQYQHHAAPLFFFSSLFSTPSPEMAARMYYLVNLAGRCLLSKIAFSSFFFFGCFLLTLELINAHPEGVSGL
jgi:hypothetical protein